MAESDIALKVHELYKSFVLPEERVGSLKQLFVKLGKRGGKKRQEVLKGVGLEVKKGEFLGIVGRNGSGKSTLLRLLAGVYTPDSGAVEVHGGLTPFIELGVGFNPELSGRDNVFLNASLLGYSRRQTEAMYDDIVKFAELEKHMDKKLKNYSSGMQVRLAFSIAIKAKNDILIFDEVLAVGDVNFQRKCFRYFAYLKQNGHTVVFVSHSMEQVQDYCTRVIVLDAGKILFDGEPIKAIQKYNSLNKETDEQKETQEAAFSYTSGSGEARVLELEVGKREYAYGDSLVISTKYDASQTSGYLYFGLSIYRSDRSQSVFALSGQVDPQKQRLRFTVKDLVLSSGDYFVSFGLTGEKDNWRTHYDLWEKQCSFKVAAINEGGKYDNLGPVYMETKVENEGK